MNDYLQIGVITSTHGIRGEVKVFPTTDDNRRFKKLKDCVIEYKGERIPAKAASCRFFKNMVILKLDGIDSIEAAEPYRQCPILVDREHAVPLERNEYFIADLEGMDVVTEEGRPLGVLKEILFTGANDVYVIADEAGKELLLPAIRDCILDVSVTDRKMTVRLLNGMEAE